MKRYPVDTKYEIVMLKNNIKLLENKESDKFIEWELLKSFDFYTYLLFKLDIYDDKNDTIMLLQAIKVSY